MDAQSEKDLIEDVGGLKANVETYHKDTKHALDLITGNGKPEDGILYIMTDIRKGIAGIKEWTEKHVCETHEALDARVEGLEKSAAAATNKEAGATAATSGAVVIKYRWIERIKFLWHPVAFVIYILLGSGGTVVMNFKSIIKFLVSAVIENYKNGGN
jgi:hypothetical protein